MPIFSRRYEVVVVSDLDHTMVAHDDPEHTALKEFNALWKRSCAPSGLLVFSTGRSLAKYHQLRAFAPDLQHPDLLVCSVGTEIYHLGAGEPALDQSWLAHLSEGWDRAACEAVAAGFPALAPQEPSEQRPHKLSYTLDGGPGAGAAVAARLQGALRDAGLGAKVVYSGGRDVDILPDRAGKGQALAFLLQHMAEEVGPPTKGTLVCGDSGNDVDLFKVEGVFGVAVSNSHPELREFAEGEVRGGNDRVLLASRECAGGIVEALGRFGLAGE